MQKRFVLFGVFLLCFIYFVSVASAADVGVTNPGKSEIPEMDIGQIQTSGKEIWIDNGVTIEINYDELKQNKDKLRQALDSCPFPTIIDCDKRCGGLKSIAGTDCYQACNREQNSKINDYKDCLYLDELESESEEAISGWSMEQIIWLKANHLYDSFCPSAKILLDQAQACEKTCPGNQYSMDPEVSGPYWECWLGFCRRNHEKQWFNSLKCEIQAYATTKSYFNKWLELVGGEVPSGKEEPEMGGSNTDPNRGRGSGQRINPSFAGYLGDAYVMRSDGIKVIPGKELYLKVEDKLTTGKNSKLNFIFKDVGGINLGPNTELRVGNALLDQYYLARGTLKTQINWGTLPPQKLEFHTPNAVVNVKGTEFVIDYNETSNITTVYLNEGSLEIYIGNKITNLEAGNYLVIHPNGITETNQLESKKWSDLGNNFYETPDTGKTFKNIVMTMFFIDIIFIIVLSLWMRKKIKNPDRKDESTSKGTASLVLGILGIILLFAPYIGIIFSAIAFYLSKIQKANKPTRLATAGFILGMIGLILNILILIGVFMNILVS